MPDDDWSRYLTPDEQVALGEVQEWIESQSSDPLTRVLTLAHKPVEYGYHRLPEQVKSSLSEAVSRVLDGMRDGSAMFVSRERIFARIAAETGRPIQNPRDLFGVSIRSLDRVALDFMNLARGGAAVEGATAGVAGVVGLVADVPALYGLLLKMIQEVAQVYGFHVKPAAERMHIIKVLDAGHYLESEKKQRAMADLDQLGQQIRLGLKNEDLERFLFYKGLQTVARHVSVSLAQRKIGQAVFVVGSVIGASVNQQLARDTGQVAFHAYRRRFLRELALRRRAGELPTPL